MKKIFLVIASVCSIVNSYSQDTIQFVSKQILVVKISEIGLSDVKYNRFDNLTGPQYIVSKKEISFIKFANGQIDRFQETVVEAPPVVYNNVPEAPAGPTKIQAYGNRLSYNNRNLNDTKLLMLIQNYPSEEGKSKLKKEYVLMKNYKSTQYIVGFSGLGLGLACPIIGGVIAADTPSNGLLFIKNNNVQTVMISAVAGIIVGVTCSVISSVFKAKRYKKRREIATIYNEFK